MKHQTPADNWQQRLGLCSTPYQHILNVHAVVEAYNLIVYADAEPVAALRTAIRRTAELA